MMHKAVSEKRCVLTIVNNLRRTCSHYLSSGSSSSLSGPVLAWDAVEWRISIFCNKTNHWLPGRNAKKYSTADPPFFKTEISDNVQIQILVLILLSLSKQVKL